MAFTVLLIVVFGIGIAVPAVWSIVGLARGKPGSWPGVVGTAFAVLLLVVTFVSIATHGGSGPDSDGVVVCRSADAKSESDCKPSVWKPERGESSGCSPGRPGPIPAGDIPSRAYCRSGQTPVYSYCEHFHTGGVKQPWATWSDLSFIAAGLWLLWLFQFFGRPGSTGTGSTTISMTADNPMITIGWLSIAYGFIVIFMGPPSQWYHASMKEWAGWFDSMSVVIWLMFNAVYVTYALVFAMWGKGRGAARTITVLSVWGGLVLLYGIIAAAFPHARIYLYFASGGPWGIAEVIYLFVAAFAAGVVYRRTWWLFAANFGLLALTMGLWVLFNDGIISPTSCQGREDFPGHAVFHILASFSTLLTFFSFASERRVSV